MLKTDYLLKMIEEAVRAITRAKDERRAGENEAAQATLDRTLEELTGLPLNAVLAMPLATLLDLLSAADRFEPERVLTVAQALHERGLAAPGGGTAQRCFQRSLCLYDEVTRVAPAAPALAEHEPFIAALLARLTPVHG